MLPITHFTGMTITMIHSCINNVNVTFQAMNYWLNDFAYRVSIHADIFLITAFAALIITFTTIGFQAIKAAMANPVKSLRTE